MALLDFPTQLAGRQDSKFYSMRREDKVVKTSTEGGYEMTRPRTTRAARRIFTTGFTDLSQAEYDILESFLETVGTFTEFNWTDPTTLQPIEVRIVTPPTAKYLGFGGNHRYNVSSIEMKES